MISHEMIQAFLNVLEYGNISAAAERTFTTQSNMSKQIQALEKETGVPLIIRSKGHAAVSLTPYGREFLKLARQWQSLMKDFDNIRNISPVTEISIGALDRINSFTLRDFYRKTLLEHDDIRLDIHTRHSREIYAGMENNVFDLGFVSTLLPVYSLKVTPFYEEPMFVVCSRETKLPKTVSPKDLDPEMEVYSRWSDEFEIWHDQFWPGKKYRIHVGTTSMTPDYLTEKGRWSIMPVSALHALLETHQFTHHVLDVETPVRTVYLLEQKNPRQSRREVIETVKKEIILSLQNDPYLKIIDPAIAG